MKLSILLFMIISTFLQTALAQENLRPPYKLQSFRITANGDAKNTAQISLISVLKGSGEVSVDLRLPSEMGLLSGEAKTNMGNHARASLINQTWEVSLPERDDYYFIEVGLDFIPIQEDLDNRDFVGYHSFDLYFEIEDGQIINYGQKPDPKFTAPPTPVERVPNEDKPPAILVPFDTTMQGQTTMGKVMGASAVAATYDILVQISGKVTYLEDNITPKGVPSVAVYLDWDYDNDPNTGYTFYDGGNTQHLDYDKTAMDGSYYFSFIITGCPYPANYYSDQIRVYANNANEAAFDGDMGLGAKMPQNKLVDISSATTSVFSTPLL